MKQLYAVLIALVLFNAGCKKLDSDDISAMPAADFKFAKGNSVYITEVFEIIPAEEKGKLLDWTCDYGNGVKIKGNVITNITYTYVKEGNYKITFTVGDRTTSQTLRVFPAFRSYQVKSSLSGNLFVSTSVGDSRDKGAVLGILKPNTITDTVFNMSSENQAVKLRVLGVYTGKNSIDYTYFTSSFAPPLQQYAHTVIELKDDEPITVNYTANGKPNERYITLGDLLKL